MIPVLEIESARRAKPLAEALLAGTLPAAEVTFRTDAAIESIRVIASDVVNLIVGSVKPESAAQYLQKKHPRSRRIVDGKFDVITRMAKEASGLIKQHRRNHS